MHSGWWVKLEGDQSNLRELAMHFTGPELEVAEGASDFYLTSTGFASATTEQEIQQRGRDLLAVAAGALHVEFGSFRVPRVAAAVQVDEHGAKRHFVLVVNAIRLHGEINARVQRARPDGSVEIVDLVAPPPQTSEWAQLAGTDSDVGDVLSILGREDVRWHDLYHVFEIIEADVGKQMFTDKWATKAAVERFTQTANSRHAIGRDARHGHKRHPPPTKPLTLGEAHDLVLVLARRWLGAKAPPAPPREVVVEVRPPNASTE